MDTTSNAGPDIESNVIGDDTGLSVGVEVALDADFHRFVRKSIEKYGLATVVKKFEHTDVLESIAMYAYNLMELFEQHRRTPFPVGSVIFLDKYRIRDEHHWIITALDHEIWFCSKGGTITQITVQPTGNYTWIITHICWPLHTPSDYIWINRIIMNFWS